MMADGPPMAIDPTETLADTLALCAAGDAQATAWLRTMAPTIAEATIGRDALLSECGGACDAILSELTPPLDQMLEPATISIATIDTESQLEIDPCPAPITYATPGPWGL